MKVKAEDLLNIANIVLTQMGVEKFRDVKLGYVNKIDDEWRVTLSFRDEAGWFATNASFAINGETGEIRGMWLGRQWEK